MLTTILTLTTLLVFLGGSALAGTHPRHIVTIATRHPDDVRTLLAKTQAARAALARGEPRVAQGLVSDALALEAKLGRDHRYAMLETEGDNTIEQIATTRSAAVVKTFDRFAEEEILDLRAARRNLVRARMDLDAGKLRDADRALANVGRPIRVEEQLGPDLIGRATENLDLAVRELSTGKITPSG